MRKITMLDNLTLYINKQECKIEIDEKFTKFVSLDEIEDLELSMPGFLDIQSISRQNNKVYLVYDLPKGYQSFNHAKNFIPVVKLQLIKSLLDVDPLLESNGMTYLDLNNIYFENYNEVKIMYRANEYLPYHTGIGTLEQYKLFILGFFSNKYSYKRFIVNKDNLLRKENNDFMYRINSATSFGELKTIVDMELEKEQTRFYEKIQNEHTSQKRGFKTKILGSFVGLLLVVILFSGGMKKIEKNVRLDFEHDLEMAQIENDLVLALSSGDTEKAQELMSIKGDDPQNIAHMLVLAGKYDEAIKQDETIEREVVERLYELGQQEKISELKSNSTFISFEKDIVEYDVDNLSGNYTLIEDKDTLKRLVFAFITHDHFELAEEVLLTMKSEDSLLDLNSTELKEVNLYLKKVDLEIEVKNISEQLVLLKQNESFGESDEQLEKRENEIKGLEEELVKHQKSLIKLDEEIGIDAE